MKYIKSLVAISAFSLAILVVPYAASAQWLPSGGPGYGNGYNRDLKPMAKSLKQRSKDFEKQVDRATKNNNNRWGNQYNDKYLKDIAKDFRKAADKFESKYDSRNHGKGADAARDMLNAASRLDNALRSSRNNGLIGQWNSIQYEVNMVANAYGYRHNNRTINNRNNRGGNSPIFNGRFPWPF